MRHPLVLIILALVVVLVPDAQGQEPPPEEVRRRAVRAFMFRDCSPEEVPASDLLVAVGVRSGQTLTNLTIGPDDKAEALKLVSARVEPGEQPLTIALSLVRLPRRRVQRCRGARSQGHRNSC
jgi:hypothetical protein